MVEEENVNYIYVTNPLDLLKYLERYVKIVLENKEVVFGTVYTIDPVSQSVILINKEVTEELSLKIILKHAINSMEIVDEIPVEQQNIVKMNIFNSQQISVCQEERKKLVKNWLEKNMIPVTENGDKLMVESLEIHPPYGPEQCYCNNSVVLSRIQKLLRESYKE